MSEPEPLFEKGIHRYRTGMIEFRDFLRDWKPIYQQFAADDPDFKALMRIYQVVADARHPPTEALKWTQNGGTVPMLPTMQVKFLRRMYGAGRLNHKLDIAWESGATLVYSPGGDGCVAVLLYPAGGDLADAKEAILIVRYGQFTSHQLRKFFPKDLRSLMDYAIVTSIDGTPTIPQKLRVWWLRQTGIRLGREAQVEQKDGLNFGSVAKLTAGTIVKSAIVAAMKPVGYLVAVVILLILTSWGFFEWAGIQRVPDVYQLEW